jgi:hypothetical protein
MNAYIVDVHRCSSLFTSVLMMQGWFWYGKSPESEHRRQGLQPITVQDLIHPSHPQYRIGHSRQ